MCVNTKACSLGENGTRKEWNEKLEKKKIVEEEKMYEKMMKKNEQVQIFDDEK